MLHVDLPTRHDFDALNEERAAACVSIYLETTPLSQAAAADALKLRALCDQAADQLREAGLEPRLLDSITGHVASLVADDGFWETQANSLAVFVTPEALKTFRLPNRLSETVQVADRFHLNPLLRSLNFANAALVLAISENDCRLIEVSAELPARVVAVTGLPKDAASAVGKSTLNDRSADGRVQGTEGQNVRLAQYARRVNAALRPVLAGRDLPLVLAAASRMAASYRTVNTYPSLLEGQIEGTDDRASASELAELAREVLDQEFAKRVQQAREHFDARVGAELATAQLSEAARAATYGAVETLMVDIDAVVPGSVDEQTGELTLASAPGASSYDVVDEIASRALRTGAGILAVRKNDLPTDSPVAAVLRYVLRA